MSQILKKSTLMPLAVLLTAMLALVVPSMASAEDQGQDKDRTQNSEGAKKPELTSTYDSRYWGSPKKDISTSADQDEYNQSQAAIPGIQGAHSEVFGMFAGRQSNSAAAIGGRGDLTNHRGKVLDTVHIYPIFWGPVSTTTFTSDYQNRVKNFFLDMQCGGVGYKTCTGHSDLVSQYFGTKPTVITSPRIFIDLTTPPTSAPTSTSIAAEAAKVVAAANLTMDPAGLYMVFTSNFPARANYCAWHSAGSYKSPSASTATWFAVAYMPYVGTMTGCSARNIPGYVSGSGGNLAIDSVINVSTHELFEAMTDSLLNNSAAWYDAAGYENGDKCAWYFGSTINGYRVQSEYSNTIFKSAAKGCPDLTS